jgi:hypothetical protein
MLARSSTTTRLSAASRDQPVAVDPSMASVAAPAIRVNLDAALDASPRRPRWLGRHRRARLVRSWSRGSPPPPGKECRRRAHTGIAGEPAGDLLHMRRYLPSPGRHRSSEQVTERRHHPAHALRRLHEVPSGERPIAEQVDHVPVDRWSACFHHVQCERRSGGRVGVDDPHPGIESQRAARDGRLSLKQCVEIVQDRVGWIRREARIAGDL